MTQTARPVSDVTTDSWTTEPLFSKINDASDATYITGPDGDLTACEVKLAALTDPISYSDHIIYARAKVASGSGTVEQLSWRLYQGTTAISTTAAVTISRTTITTYHYYLTAGQANAITDYADLRIRLAQGAVIAGENINVYDVWMECPDAAQDAEVVPNTVAAVAAIPQPTVIADANADAVITPVTVAAIAAVPAPTIWSGGNATVTPTTVDAVAAVPAPTVAAGASPAPSTVAAVATVPAPTVAAGASVTPTTVAARAAVSMPTIVGAQVLVVWAIDLYNLGGTAVLSNATVKGARFTWVLNAPGAFEAELEWTASRTDWAVGQRIVQLTRNSVVVWGGYLWGLSGNAQARTVGVSGEGYFSMLRHRVVTSDLSYEDVEQQTIAWNLIDHAQGQANGDLGFTLGHRTGHQTPVTRSRDYCARERPNVGDEITNLASAFVDGFDFEIDPATKKFNTWDPARGVETGIILTGSDELTLEWDEDASEAASYVTATGSDNCSQPLVDVSDPTAISTFGRLHEAITVDSDKLHEVTAAASEELRQRKTGLFRATAAWDDEYGPAWGTYGLGDYLTVAPADSLATFSKAVRLVELAVQLESPTQAYVEAVLDGAL